MKKIQLVDLVLELLAIELERQIELEKFAKSIENAKARIDTLNEWAKINCPAILLIEDRLKENKK